MAAVEILNSSRAGDRSGRARLMLAALSLLLLVTTILSIALGPMFIHPADAVRLTAELAMGGRPEGVDAIVIGAVRLPRTGLGILVGAALGLSGAILQALFRNPLAEPGLIGVSSGAALAAMMVIVLGVPSVLATAGLGVFDVVPFAAFAGGLVCTLLLYAIATRGGRTATATMLLAGIALGAIAAAGTGVLVFLSTDQQLRDLTFWSLGSLAGATPARIGSAALLIIPAIAAALIIPASLNGLLLGEAQAMHLGVDVQRTKAIAIVTVSLAVGGAVAVAGVIGFVGIVVPHVLRLVIGPDHRYLLVSSALLGASLLLAADIIARLVAAPAELPIGIVTALLGGPFFLWLLLRQKGLVDV